jgi:two-component system alkaline phosphatase synthesis response regulator PhoP
VAKVLVVDDEQHILDLLTYNLAAAGLEVATAADGLIAIEKVKIEEPKLVLLDMMLPKMDGLQVCRYLRANLNYKQPIIMISGKGEIVDKVLGLEMGANDYVTKPFSLKEITARVKANLRLFAGQVAEANDAKQMAPEGPGSWFDFDDRGKKASCQGMALGLTPKEFELLKVLVKNQDKALRREYLLNYVWGNNYQEDSRTLDVHIRYLRQKLEMVPGCNIATVRGYGYRLGILS